MGPNFRYLWNGELIRKNSPEAERESKIPKSGYADPHDKVQKAALEAVRCAGGEVTNSKHVLGQYIFQVGQFKGKFHEGRVMVTSSSCG